MESVKKGLITKALERDGESFALSRWGKGGRIE